jgi:chromate reductase
MMRLLAISGSLRSGSTNDAALRTIQTFAPDDVEVVVFEGMAALPHFNPDDDHEPLAAPVVELRRAIGSAGALLFCTPEYAGALPGAFKNLLDWTVGGPEMDGKKVAWINVSGVAAPTGGADAHDSLRRVLGYVNADVVEPACARVPLARSAVGDSGLVEDQLLREELLRAAAALCASIGTQP